MEQTVQQMYLKMVDAHGRIFKTSDATNWLEMLQEGPCSINGNSNNDINKVARGGSKGSSDPSPQPYRGSQKNDALV